MSGGKLHCQIQYGDEFVTTRQSFEVPWSPEQSRLERTPGRFDDP